MARGEDDPAGGATSQMEEHAHTAGPPNEEVEKKLLSLLDPDPRKATEWYLTIRRKLISYFSNWRCPDPEDLADETISRAYEAIDGGKQLEGENALDRFIFGIALYVRLEEFRRRQKEESLIGGSQGSPSPLYQPDNLRAECLKQCLQKLPPKERALIIVYEGYESREREALAKRLDMSYSGLRTKVARIRRKLVECAEDC